MLSAKAFGIIFTIELADIYPLAHILETEPAINCTLAIPDKF